MKVEGPKAPRSLSVFVITFNEERRLGATLEAARSVADELVVVDSGSTDETTAIAKRRGARILHRDWTGYGEQKRFAEDACSHDWLLNLDADEVLSDELAAEIKAVMREPDLEPCGFKVAIKLVYPGEQRPRGRMREYNVVRLYHRSAGRYSTDPAWDRVEMNEGAPIRQLRGVVHHFAVLDWAQLADKNNRLSGHALERVAERPRWLLRARVYIEFPATFIRVWLFRGQCLDGWKGFVAAMNTAFMRTMRIAKALELQERNAKRDRI